MKKWAKISTIVGSGVLLAGAGAGTVAGIVIPKTLKLKDGLGHFVPGDGQSPMKHWNAQKKLNYVALGDSETAGFNGFLQGTPELGGSVDYVSYADILASDLGKSGNLNEYHNYAVSGATIPDQQKLFGENPLIHRTIKEADLITVTIGANDLLSFVRLLDLPFKLSLDGLVNTLKGKITDYNATRDRIFGENGSVALPGQNESPSEGPSQSETSDMLHKSINLLADMVRTGNYSHIINLEEDFKEKIFDLIYRNFMMFIHDLREVAPHAQIIVLGHAMPFAQWPTSNVLDSPRADMGGQTIRGLYQKMITKMREGTTFSLTGNNDYATFLEVDKLRIRKSADGTHETDTRDNGSRFFTDYIKHNIEDPHFYERNAMPNAADIHPSTFGHQLIGNAVYDHIASSLGVSNPVANYTFTQKFDGIYNGPLESGDTGYEAAVSAEVAPFERIDENPSLSHTTSSTLLDVLNNRSSMIMKLLKLILPNITDVTDFTPITNLMESNALNEISAEVAKIEDGNMVTKLMRVLSDPKNDKAYQALKTNIDTLFKSSEKSKPLGEMLIAVLEMMKSNNPLTALLIQPLSLVMKDDSDRHYESINDYMAAELGITATRATVSGATSCLDNLNIALNRLSNVLKPPADGTTPANVIKDFALAKQEILANFTQLTAALTGMDDPSNAVMIKQKYDLFVDQIQKQHPGITITKKANPTVDDIFNYLILNNIVNARIHTDDSGTSQRPRVLDLNEAVFSVLVGFL